MRPREKHAMDMVEQALINIMFARAELAATKNERGKDAIARAIEHIDWALSDLKILTPRYDEPESDRRSGAA